MAGALPTSPLWTPYITPNALPYMVQTKCYNACVETPPCQLTHFPQPCLCVVQSTTGAMPNPPEPTPPGP